MKNDGTFQVQLLQFRVVVFEHLDDLGQDRVAAAQDASDQDHLIADLQGGHVFLADGSCERTHGYTEAPFVDWNSL